MILARDLRELTEGIQDRILFRQAQKVAWDIEYEYCYKSAANGAENVKCNLDWVAGFDDELLEYVILVLRADGYRAKQIKDNIIEIDWSMEK